MPSRESPQFDSLPLSSDLITVTRELGFERLTPIQAQSIPLILAGKDLIAQSKTGSGKTAAFSLPILQRLEQTCGQRGAHRSQRRLQALVLCPTRELCTQVAREIRRLGRRLPGLQVLILSGGQPMFSQIGALEKGVHIVVGTPGRVIDHLSRQTLNLSSVTTVVLDEADRMLDMGFQEDMERILGETPKTRQTLLFSATFPRSIESMSRSYQRSPVRVTAEDEAQSAPDIEEILHEVSDNDGSAKLTALLSLLNQRKPESAIVFCNLKLTVTELTRALQQAGVSASGIQGDLEQRERDRVMARFRNQSTRVLVATDVAARGIDVEKLDLVVNFDLSPDPEVYVHRIGRTGRAGRKGLAISLATTRERAKIERIEEFTSKRLERVQLEMRKAEVGEQKQTTDQSAKMETLYIAAGRKEKMRPGDILGALTGEAGGLNAVDVGKIEIHDHFSYVAVSKAVAQIAVQRLTDGKIKGRKFRVGLAR